MKTVFVFMTNVWCATLAQQGWKISKAMKNNIAAKEELLMEKKQLNDEYGEYSNARNKMENIKAKSVKDLETLFEPVEGLCKNSIVEANPSKFMESKCVNYDPRWDLVGSENTWDLVVLHQYPLRSRVKEASRLLSSTKVLIIHDTGNPELTPAYHLLTQFISRELPEDFGGSGESLWNGRPCFTDVSDLTRTSTANNFESTLSSEKRILTTIIQGDLDDGGEVYNSIKRKLKLNNNEINAAYKHYNKENLYAGTHIKLLFVAAMMTCGNILELGTDEHSAELFHDIIEKDRNDTNNRVVVSTESNQQKIKRYKIKNAVSHQLLQVPPCKAGEDDKFDEMKEQCGELCDLEKEVIKQEGEFLGTVQSKVDCKKLFQSSLLNKPSSGPPPQWHQVSDKYKKLITHNGRVPAEPFYFDDSKFGQDQGEPTIFTQEYVQGLIDQWENRSTVTLKSSKEIYEAASVINVTNLNILVIGTVEPWLEAVLFSRGAKKIMTLEYGNYISHFPGLEFVRPKEFSQRYLAGTLDTFDAVFTHSSLEHSGLGRYGDSLNPWADIVTVAQAWCTTTPDAKLVVAVPTAVSGKDAILFNGAKVYGPRLYPFLVTNWQFIWPKEDKKRISPREGVPGVAWTFQPV